MVALLSVFLLSQPATQVPVYLLGSPEVRRDIGLSHEMSVKVRGLLQQAYDLDRGGLMTTEQVKALEKKRKETPPETFLNQVAGLLTPYQTSRLKEIRLQQCGPWVFGDKDVVQKLGFPQATIKKILDRQGRAGRRYQAVFQSHTRRSPRIYEAAQKRYLEECTRAVADALDAKQELRLKSIYGRPLDVKNLHYDVQQILD